MQYLSEFVMIATIHFLAVISPGPDFAMVARNSLLYSKRIGIYSALGLSFGMMIHITYSLVGIGVLISKSILLFSVIKFAGAAYLIYIGMKAFHKNTGANDEVEKVKKTKMGKFDAIRTGFFTNVLNPKVTLFFLSIFTQFIDPKTPLAVEILYGTEMVVMTFLWFSFVAIILSKNEVRKKFSLIKGGIEKVFGAVLILLGVRVAMSDSR